MNTPFQPLRWRGDLGDRPADLRLMVDNQDAIDYCIEVGNQAHAEIKGEQKNHYELAMRDTLQQQCDRLTQAVLWRRSRQGTKPAVYLVEIVRGGEVGVAIVCHDTACTRSVRCGGNPGMPYADRFRGEQNPVFEFRGWCRRIFELRGWDAADIEAAERRPEPM